jgi:hypothetical protein
MRHCCAMKHQKYSRRIDSTRTRPQSDIYRPRSVSGSSSPGLRAEDDTPPARFSCAMDAYRPPHWFAAAILLHRVQPACRCGPRRAFSYLDRRVPLRANVRGAGRVNRPPMSVDVGDGGACREERDAVCVSWPVQKDDTGVVPVSDGYRGSRGQERRARMGTVWELSGDKLSGDGLSG